MPGVLQQGGVVGAQKAVPRGRSRGLGGAAAAGRPAGSAWRAGQIPVRGSPAPARRAPARLMVSVTGTGRDAGAARLHGDSTARRMTSSVTSARAPSWTEHACRRRPAGRPARGGRSPAGSAAAGHDPLHEADPARSVRSRARHLVHARRQPGHHDGAPRRGAVKRRCWPARWRARPAAAETPCCGSALHAASRCPRPR